VSLPLQGPHKRTYKLNVSEANENLVKPKPTHEEYDGLNGGGVGAAGKEGNGILSLRDGKFEYQRELSSLSVGTPL